MRRMCVIRLVATRRRCALIQRRSTGGIRCTLLAAEGTQRGHSSRYLGYGRHEDNEFLYNESVKTLSVSYMGDDEHPVTVVHFHCNPNASSSSISRLRLVPEEPLQVWVETPCACLNACAMGDLGLGTIFLITLSLSAAAYFILGSCALRPFRGSSGVQISPEQSVWCMVCSLCTESRQDGPYGPHPSRPDPSRPDPSRPDPSRPDPLTHPDRTHPDLTH